MYLISRGMYRDLIDEFIAHGHNLYVICPADKNSDEQALYNWHKTEDINVFLVKYTYLTGKVSMIRKALSTFTSDKSLAEGINKSGIEKFGIDLILYTTPPITMTKSISLLKKKTNAKAFLMLKDIFPQNAVDLGMMKKSGLSKIPYKLYRHIEKKLYRLSDYIGCMSQKNIDYVLENNPEIDPNKVGLCVNSYAIKEMHAPNREETLKKYGIKTDKPVFIYGGNLGKPQCIDFIIDVLRKNSYNSRFVTVICGKGSEDKKIIDYMAAYSPANVVFINGLPPVQFDELTLACDVGLIFLDKRFTIPNFPSRIITYMQAGKPILAITDRSTDVSDTITREGFGWWVESRNAGEVTEVMNSICLTPSAFKAMGEKSHSYYLEHYLPINTYNQIMRIMS